MAEIPTYQPQASPRPVGTPYDEARVSPDAFGAPIGQGLQQVGATVGDFAREQKHRADTSAVIGAIGQTKSALNSIVLDPETGYASLKGTDALEGREKAWQKFQTAIADTESTLTNDDQRRTFRLHALTLQEEGYRHIVSHEASQIEDVARSQFVGAADQTMRTLQSPVVITNPQERDKQLVDLQRLATAEAVRRFGRNAPPEAIQSVVGPIMQKAAVDAMEAATSPVVPGGQSDPAVAKSALDRVGQLLGPHERHYASVVAGLDAKQKVNAGAAAVIGPALSEVVLPGGGRAFRLDAGKVLQGLGGLSPDDPRAADITKEVERRQGILEKVWNQNLSNIVVAAQKAGDPAATGDFQMSSVPVSLRTWLHENAEDKLIALKAVEDRQDARDRAATAAERADLKRQQIADSGSNYSRFLTILHDRANKGDNLHLSSAQVQAALLDQGLFPGGFTTGDQIKALGEFEKFQKAGEKLDEPVSKTVQDVIREAFPTDKAFKKNAAKFFGPLLDRANAYVQQSELKAGETEKLRGYVAAELAKGTVKGSGYLFDDSVRRIEYELNPDYQGKTFVPEKPPLVVPARAPNSPLSTAKATRAEPSVADQAAIEWLQQNPNDPDAPAVRAKLKAKGF